MRLAKLLRRHVGEVVAVFVLLLVQALCELSLPRYMSDIVNVGVVGSEAGNSAYLGHMALVMFGFCVGSLAAAVLSGLIASRVAAAVARDLRRDVFAKVMSFSPAEVNRFSQSSLITRCTNDVQQIQNMIVIMLRMVMFAPVMGIVAVVQVMTMGGGLTWIVGAALLAVLGVVAVLFTLTMPRFKVMQSLVDRVNLLAREMLDGIMTIRAFGRQGHELKRFDAASGDLRDAQLFVNRAMTLMMPLMMLVMNVATVAIVWFGSHGVAAGAMQAGDMMAFISYAMMIVMSFLVVSMVAVILPRAEVSVGRVQEVLDVTPAVREPKNPVAPAEDAPSGRLVFDHVGFHYPDAEGNVVSDVSFATMPGKVTAIVGSTGSGKSTLVQLVPRLYDPTAGTITLDGVDTRKMSLADLRSRVGYVPQQGFLFSGTIASNVAFGTDGASEKDLLRAIDVAQATELVTEKEDGLKTTIAQGGTNVSGGQRQRLAIARALATRPEVLVLDDSFSALDYATDARLRQALAREQADTAVLVVAQRIATVMGADQIIVLDEGRVVGQGTHEELLRSCPEYLEIAKSQLSAKELGLAEGE
ncbi:ABC transporter ATP-binding protein [Olsenella sp. AM30-3LB]|uniref:ABC transporter ATP-binding protein n=1 Tax=Atopobiaceae TaxID=1643824 RepID=UPI0005098014|nr:MULTISPECIES: ABC transporter ATP-binding protein [unclassified Olsenella]RGJ47947.1 ABC transporter ATP-binding protein [Olsenella sp. TM06-36]RGS50802.1 ABC transporter ATP-binding protein [Olsenella sp. AF21-51]RHB57395.1 ABC transporter ATP-binding protein [Olsenella sp. AM39-30AC]RHD71802.1 ABC transporter ATP-binding protein [Olsenella sp. AM30-3LB]RHJ94277.1 ABC transporter ATP-binding protein [Olsenella sp. AM05-7]